MTLIRPPLGLALLVVPRPAPSQPDTTADTAALEFRGFRAGARLDELQALVQHDGWRTAPL